MQIYKCVFNPSIYIMLGWLTIPCIEHVCNEVVYEGNLGLWDATRVSVKHRHNHRETLSLLLICLWWKTLHN